jgi:hypothetical protein
MTHFLVDGIAIKRARKTGNHQEALRVFRDNEPECRCWGVTITCGEVRVHRATRDAEFRIDLLAGEFECGSPEPDKRDKTKHIYIQQSLRRSRLDALIVSLYCETLYHHDVKIVGDCEIVYDRNGRGLGNYTQLWIQTRNAIIVPAGPWTRIVPRLIDDNPR